MIDTLAGKKILIFQQRNWGRGIGHFLAGKLTAEGCRLAALTFKPTTHAFIIGQTDVRYDFIASHDEIMGSPRKYLNGQKYSLSEICQELGVDSIWPAVSGMRNLVKSYGDRFYYSFRQNVPDETIIDYVMAVYKFIRQLFYEFKPDLIIAPNFVALPHIMLNLYAKRRGIPMFAVTDSKVPGYNIFTYSYFDDSGPFYDRVDALNFGRETSANLAKAKAWLTEFRRTFALTSGPRTPERSLWQKVRRELSPLRQMAEWYWKPQVNYLESTGITIDWRPPRIILRDHFARKRYEKFADTYQYYPFEKVGRFVYFPLQVQPEESIDVVSPYFSNQIETARLMAQSLPDDLTLVVKDHPDMFGHHPPSYLIKLARTPNIKLVNWRISGNELVSKADLVLGASGTTLAEAAFCLKPVIQLGNLGTNLKLPTIFQHTDLTSLSRKIKQVLGIKLATAENERKLENFVAAVFDTGFDFDYVSAWERGRGNLEELWPVYRREIEGSLFANHHEENRQ